MKFLFTILIIALNILFLQTLKAESLQDPEGAYGFGGFDLGYAISYENDDEIDDRDGFQFNALGGFAYYSKSFVFDLGAGWFYNQVSSDDVTITTKSPMGFVAARYRFNSDISIGPKFLVITNNDNSLSDEDEGKNSVGYGGISFAYEFKKFKINKLRLVADVIHDLSLNDRDVILSTIGLQYAIPFSDRHIQIKEKVVTKEKIVYRPYIKIIGKDRVRATFDAGTGLYFATDSDEANFHMQVYLERLGYFLSQYPKEYRRILISGHTDDRGSYDYNLDLSNRRALTVQRILRSHKVAPRRMSAKGYSWTRRAIKKTDPRSRAKNRRVELEFTGVKRVNFFKKALSLVNGYRANPYK
ncbi:OmpA family protein [Bacteriovoracaceae bacterium]|nr:OmpA family protein [Bacteriovoracaceae bacterium]